MTHVLVAIGSMGDVRPQLALARALIAEGTDVLLLGLDDYAEAASECDVPFRGVGARLMGPIASPVVARAAFKPISTVPRALRSIDLATGEEAVALHQRSDACQVVPGAVIAQAEVALVLADALFEHAGGNSVGEMRRNLESYLNLSLIHI